MIQSFQQETKPEVEVLSVHRHISRAEWLTIHNHSAAEYRQSEWTRENLFGAAKHRRKLFAQARGKVLDVACGYGINFDYLPKAAQITAVDFSPLMLSMARENALQLGMEVNMREADAEHLEFADNSFDTVISALSTCSFMNPIAALKEMRRVVKPDGKILLVEHGRSNYAWLGRYQDKHRNEMVEQGGCRWNQEPPELVQQSGMKILSHKRTLFGIFHSIEASPAKTA
jgi:ubiquinone/menaquinone biosynthesis C-methylase UbiE